jgi:DNA-binding transcriptional MocR family regulator
MAVELLLKATLWNSGVVGIESPGSPEIRKIIESNRVAILNIPADADGLKVDELAKHLEAGVPLRLIFLSTACQHPTGARLSEERRQVLLGLVTRHQIVVAEDDGAAAWYWDTPPPLPLAHLDCSGKVVHFGSFDRWLAPGIHSGFIYARRSVANRLAGLKKTGHMVTDQVLESALASLLTRDALHIHLRQARKHYVSRLQRAAEIIESWPGFHVEPGVGGLGLWVRLPDHLDAQSWQRACAQQNISLMLGSDFGELPGPYRHVYLGLAKFDHLELEGLLAKLASCWQSLSPQKATGPSFEADPAMGNSHIMHPNVL